MYYPDICLVELRTVTMLSQYSRCTEWDSNTAPPKYIYWSLPLRQHPLWNKFRIKICELFFNVCSGWWSPIGSTRHCGHQWPIVPASGDYDDGEIGGMIGRGNRSTRRKPTPVPLCPPQTPHSAHTRTRAAAVGSQRLTAWATAWPCERFYVRWQY
jgi:hypothetical protein